MYLFIAQQSNDNELRQNIKQCIFYSGKSSVVFALLNLATKNSKVNKLMHEFHVFVSSYLDATINSKRLCKILVSTFTDKVNKQLRRLQTSKASIQVHRTGDG